MKNHTTSFRIEENNGREIDINVSAIKHLGHSKFNRTEYFLALHMHYGERLVQELKDEFDAQKNIQKVKDWLLGRA